MINRLYIFPLALIILIVDQLTKCLVLKNLFIGENISLINNVISITKAYNTGAAFSLLQDKTQLLTFFSLIVAISISFYFLKKAILLPYMLICSWGLILGGTVGNLIDRLMYGYVIDLIKLDFINFPIFNISDLSINIGALLIIIYSIKQSKSSISEKKE